MTHFHLYSKYSCAIILFLVKDTGVKANKTFKPNYADNIVNQFSKKPTGKGHPEV
jgi:hypothetical protein